MGASSALGASAALAAALAGALAVALAAAPRAALGQQTPAGFWTTTSDADGQPRGIVEIREVGGEYVGIVRGIPADAGPEDSLCTKCSAALKGQRIVGMQILSHMRRDGDAWTGGEILDPETGRSYRATMKLADGGAKLLVRGYLRLPIFGRSQVWVRRR
jgi:uncharacterized protein (DUF2147 family)